MGSNFIPFIISLFSPHLTYVTANCFDQPLLQARPLCRMNLSTLYLAFCLSTPCPQVRTIISLPRRLIRIIELQCLKAILSALAFTGCCRSKQEIVWLVLLQNSFLSPSTQLVGSSHLVFIRHLRIIVFFSPLWTDCYLQCSIAPLFFFFKYV